MSKRYFCDRCKKELGDKKHAVVEIVGARYDVCPSCLGPFELFRVKVEAAAHEGKQNLRQRVAALKAEYLERPKDGPETKRDGSEEENR
jgi:hypothetical protein